MATGDLSVIQEGAVCLRVLLVVVVLSPTFAAAQELRPSTTRSAEMSNAVSATSVSQFGTATRHHCCNRKGAIIGAAIGGAFGFWLARNTCDAGSCATAYVQDMVILGGIGATLGIFADHTAAGRVFPSARRVHVGWVLTPRVHAGMVRIGF